ncbi:MULTISPECIES: alpha/beta hydrolase family protein [unclassified Rhodococcus (in: high G+C Gram-positive bacteria)]|uniref:alpha/beta hydrolase n=1 Tax=unclassified Rhodococcus (in: high G+C Gram-positive bacteria) TaxID=192944 RepID=UPI0021BFA3E8|nr:MULTISPECIES: alpha/beta hydrolase family protein [unclassified Rhodococcus (in: high G+C Gram-positive bacteria)]
MRQALVSVVMAAAIPLGLAVVGTGATANAEVRAGFDVWSDSSMGPIKSRVWRAKDGNTSKVVYLLDGLRATPDISGWEHETNAGSFLSDNNINVVQPVGGESSFYTDWYAPSNFNGQRITYKWETFLTKDLPNRLAAGDLNFSRTRNGIVGLSMGGSAALTLAAYHPNQFSYAGSLSGYLNISAPGMREAIRVAMLDAGRYNVDSMWGPPWDPAWLRNDPFVFAPRLRDNGTRVWVSAASGLPGVYDRPASLLDYYNTANGMGLEALALANSRAFQVRMASIGANNVTYSFPGQGTHRWGYWFDQVVQMMPDLRANIG